MNAPEAYEQFLVPYVFRPWAEEVLRRAGDLKGRSILDVATGTGIGARLASIAAGATGHVTGLDIDPAMLDVAARSAAAQTGTAAPINWIEASALAMPLPDASFDIAICLEGLQFFPDLVIGLSEIRRVLVPGGRLHASCWAALVDNPGYRAISEGLRLFCSEAAARLPPFALADPDKIAQAVQAAGYSNAVIERHEIVLTAPSATEFLGWVAAGGPTIRHNIAQLTEDRREEFSRFVEQALAPFATAEGHLCLPSARNILAATR